MAVDDKLLLNDGSSYVLLNDGSSRVRLNGERGGSSGGIDGQFGPRQTLAAAEGQLIVPQVGTYRPVSASFDGSDDNLNKGSELTGAADSKLCTGSIWFKQTSSNDTFLWAQSPTASSALVSRMYTDPTGFINLDFQRSPDGGTLVFSATTTAGYSYNKWHHVCWSFDLTDTAKRHLYFDDKADLTVVTYTNADIEFTNGDFYVGNRGDNPSFFDWNGELAEFFYYPGLYIDLSVEANRRLFITHAGFPADPSALLASSLGTPLIGLYGPVWSTWATNKGSGGGMTANNGVAEGTRTIRLSP